MRFSTWFKSWVRLLMRILTFDYFRERRRHPHRQKWKLPSKKKSRKSDNSVRRSGVQILFGRALVLIRDIVAFTVGLILLPIGVVDWLARSSKVRKKRKEKTKGVSLGETKGTTTSDNRVSQRGEGKFEGATTSSERLKQPTNTQGQKNVEKKHKPDPCQIKSHKKSDLKSETKDKTDDNNSDNAQIINPPSCPISSMQGESPGHSRADFTEIKGNAPEPDSEKARVDADYGEDTPKSSPKSPGDRYIRKRMIIESLNDSDFSVLSTLGTGTYLDVSVERGSSSEGDVIALSYGGRRVGYVAKEDSTALLTCLKLKRKIYAVITDVSELGGEFKYEFETWFSY